MHHTTATSQQRACACTLKGTSDQVIVYSYLGTTEWFVPLPSPLPHSPRQHDLRPEWQVSGLMLMALSTLAVEYEARVRLIPFAACVLVNIVETFH